MLRLSIVFYGHGSPLSVSYEKWVGEAHAMHSVLMEKGVLDGIHGMKFVISSN